MMGSGYPQCTLVKRRVGDFDGKITNIDGQLMVEPTGLIKEGNTYYQERWIQARSPIGKRPGESDEENYSRGDPIQLSYDDWNKASKTHKDNGCLKDSAKNPGLPQPSFCNAKPSRIQTITLVDGSTIQAVEGFVNYKEKHPVHKMVSLTVVAISLLGLAIFWSGRSKK
jgi:hypothetical protein